MSQHKLCRHTKLALERKFYRESRRPRRRTLTNWRDVAYVFPWRPTPHGWTQRQSPEWRGQTTACTLISSKIEPHELATAVLEIRHVNAKIGFSGQYMSWHFTVRRSLFRQKTSTEVLLDQGPQYLTRITKNYLHYRDTTPFIKLDYIFTLEKKIRAKMFRSKGQWKQVKQASNEVYNERRWLGCIPRELNWIILLDWPMSLNLSITDNYTYIL